MVDCDLDICSFIAVLKCLQFMSCHTYDSKAFQTQGPAAEKLLLLELLCMRGTTHTLSDADWRAASVGSRPNVGSNRLIIIFFITAAANHIV